MNPLALLGDWMTSVEDLVRAEVAAARRLLASLRSALASVTAEARAQVAQGQHRKRRNVVARRSPNPFAPPRRRRPASRSRAAGRA